MQAQLARVVEAEQLDAREARLEQGTVLGRGVLAQMPRVVRLLRPGGREREPVRGRDVADRRQRCEAFEQGGGILDVLDRLQEDDRVAALTERLDEAAVEAQVRPPVAQSGVLVGLGVYILSGVFARAE